MTSIPIIGISLKSYFGLGQTMRWAARVSQALRGRVRVRPDSIELFVLPSFPALVPVIEVFKGAPIAIGSQDLSSNSPGAFTGEVSAEMLAEIGCRFVEIGHAERRRLHAESTRTIAAKLRAAQRTGLTPILCVGEGAHRDIESCAAEVVADLDSIEREMDPTFSCPRALIAYEPRWAIGEPRPASLSHIEGICKRIREFASRTILAKEIRVLYGGSAGRRLAQRPRRKRRRDICWPVRTRSQGVRRHR